MAPDNAFEKLAESGSFAALCVILLMFIWWLIREQNRKDTEHTSQIERINNAHDASIEKVTAQFTCQIEKMAASAAIDRKESTAAFNQLSALLNNAIEKRGQVQLRDNL